jgi:hypothetical protein
MTSMSIFKHRNNKDVAFMVHKVLRYKVGVTTLKGVWLNIVGTPFVLFEDVIHIENSNIKDWSEITSDLSKGIKH